MTDSVKISNLRSLIARWQASVDDAEKMRDTTRDRGLRIRMGIKSASHRMCIIDLEMEIRREIERQPELVEVDDDK